MSLIPWKSSAASASQSFIQSPTSATLDDLYAAASELGEVEIGGISSKSAVEIKIHGEFGYLYIKCKKYETLKENLSECIRRAEYITRAIKNY